MKDVSTLETDPRYKRELFHAPEGYFDAFPYQLQQRIAGLKREPRQSFAGRLVLSYVLPYATVLLVVCIGFLGLQPHPTSTQLTRDELLATVVERLDEYDNDLLFTEYAKAAPVKPILNSLKLDASNDTQLRKEMEEYTLEHTDSHILLDINE